MQRIHSSTEIQSNVSLTNGRLDNTALAKLIGHLKNLSRGSYLYLKLTLDLIEGGYLVLKSSSFKVSSRVLVWFLWLQRSATFLYDATLKGLILRISCYCEPLVLLFMKGDRCSQSTSVCWDRLTGMLP